MIVTSADGSHTLHVAELKEHYHSHKGALQESLYVFIEMGLHRFPENADLKLLEVGFGTGLNTLLTVLKRMNRSVEYTGLEAFPLSKEMTGQLNYPSLLGDQRAAGLYEQVHQTPWDQPVALEPGFVLCKRQAELQTFETGQTFDLIYFDAFAPHAQPELWEPVIWQKLYAMMSSGGVLVTYCAKGQVRRDMQSVGFRTERLPGPPGKREMLRATKP